MYLELLIVGCLLTNICFGESNIWRTVYVNQLYWTVESTITASSKTNCAMKASQLQWPNLIRYTGDGSCYLSSMKRAPINNVTVIPNYLLLACMSKLSPVSCQAPFTMVTGGNGCYRYIDTPVTFDDARDQCIAMGADLASAGVEKNEQLFRIVSDELGIPSSVRMWVGVKRENAQSPFLQVSTPGSPALPDVFWNAGEPGATKKCVGIEEITRLHFDIDCSTIYSFLCEIQGLKF